jgi:hypothetical protein
MDVVESFHSVHYHFGKDIMTLARIVCAALLAIVLAGGVSHAADLTPIQPLSPEQLSTLKVSGISTDTDPGVVMEESDFGLIVQQVTNYLEVNHPGMLTGAADAQALKMRVHFTRFVRGNQVKRWLLLGVGGKTSIAATVFFEDASGKQVASYNVAVSFARPGVPGATTTASDIEDMFAKSVGRIVDKKP